MVRKRRHEAAEVQDDDSSAERSDHHVQQRPGGRLQVPSTSDATAEAAHEDGETEQVRPQKKRRLHTYERARIAYDRIQEEKRLQSEQRQKDKEAREAALHEYESTKKKKEKLFRQKTKRGQPKLGNHVELLLEKIERTIKKENAIKR